MTTFTAQPALRSAYSRLLQCTLIATAAWTALATVVPTGAQAQAVYRVVGPDGRVTFSDRAPLVSGKNANEVAGATAGSASAASANGQLPFALQQSANRYPVTLYSAKECQPCDDARSFLQNRGIPFTERSIETDADQAALQKLSGQANLPFGTIGSQYLKGFSSSSWGEYLNAAGYPAQSQLPANYRPAAAKPLTTPVPVAAPAAAQKSEREADLRAAPRPQAKPGTPTRENPAGLTF